MGRFIFFTKTLWREPPRLRHQLAGLLASQGHEVLFGERPRLFPRPPSTSELPSGLRTFSHRELIHHRIRVGPLLRSINRWFAESSIRDALHPRGLDASDVVVNFNYEYFFLRGMFPSNPLVTVINDDFVSRALPFSRESIHHAQRLTCGSSDAVLTPSVVLQEQLRPYCKPQLFLPWADVPYRRPAATSGRDVLLYWGFIDWRVDFEFVERLASDLRRRAPEIELLFVGPVDRGYERAALFREHSNVRLAPASKLDALPLERVFASLIPFRSGVEGCDAIVMPNKAFQLIARGLPLLVTGMPRFAREPFVDRLDDGDAVERVLASRDRFEALQDSMRDYLEGNSPQARLEQFLTIVARARDARSAVMASAPRR